MLKLMKYEFRSRLFPKGVAIGALLALVEGFCVFYWQGMVEAVTIVLLLMELATIIILFLAPFECTFTFDKDMNTKQGYLLFLIPQKSTTVLAAKLLGALLQSTVMYILLFTVVPFFERLCLKRFGSAPDFIGAMLREFTLDLSGVPEVIECIALLLVLWLFFAVLALFISAVPGQGKVVSMFKFVGYIAAIFVVFLLLGTISGLFSYLSVPEPVANIFEWVYMIGIDVALFFGTAKLMDKKVSL